MARKQLKAEIASFDLRGYRVTTTPEAIQVAFVGVPRESTLGT